MKGLKSILLLPVLLVAALLAQQTLFVVDQTQQALVIQLGHPLDKVYGPGLHAKLPFIQNVVYFEARILDYDARPAEALPGTDTVAASLYVSDEPIPGTPVPPPQPPQPPQMRI